MYESIRSGAPLEMEEEETLASALSGGIGLKNRYTFPLIRRLVDEHVLVSEEEIADAMLYAARRLQLVVEGGGAVGLAALLEGKVAPRTPDGAVAAIISGGNVGPGTLAEVAQRRS
jgi:threonine dehydratase